ncbi:MAG: Enterobactin exporter EntS [Ignavibacteriaceae bacterium]|nr:Enterobactin exporter EntS [Ignavibacteriaceae bacterium]
MKSGFVKQTLRALRHKNYRLFFTGQSLSLIGTWMQSVALGWLVYRLTDSAFLLGLVSFASQIPTFVFASFAGVLADRYNRHKIIITTQSLAMIQAFILAYLTLSHSIEIWHIVALSLFSGLINAFDMPTRQSFVIDMVDDRNDLPNAIALNSSVFNSARLIGPTIAGFIISALGEGLCFLINAMSFFTVIIALLMMKIPPKENNHHKEKVIKEVKEGIKYAYNFKPIRALLLLIGLVSLTGMPYTVLMPVFAKDILHGDANTLGFLFGAVGTGAVVGAIYLASRKSVVGLGRWIAIATTIFSLGLLFFSFSRNIYLSVGLMLFTGFGMMMQMASTNTLLQTLVDDDKRGRIMSLYVMAFMGTAPFGSFMAGSLASTIGAPYTVLSSGIICLIGAIAFYKILPSLRKHIRPIYIKKGIIPEVSTGLQSSTHLKMPPN